ncbi:MAG TPA: response regulator [Cyclobacteriaceae bacterium]|nr:response regulator [Cyclobacteriaceae bacterium]
MRSPRTVAYLLFHRNANRLLRLISPLMNFNKPEKGGLKIIPLKKSPSDSLIPIDDSFKKNPWRYDAKIHDDAIISNTVDKDLLTKDDKPHLLIIDDNSDMRLFITHEFMDSYRISEASDGVAGFEKARTENPDIILCDVMMPHMDGITLCRKIKLHVDMRHIPIILLTAKSSDNQILEGLSSGANDYISKPFSISILKAKVKNLIALQHEMANHFLKQPLTTVREISSSSIDEKFLQKAYEVIEKNLSNQDLDVDTFSTAIGMSRAQLYRKIQTLSGQSVKEFIRIIRLKRAAEILTKENLNISQVAFDVGFSSVAYFTKSFSAYFGVTPSKYISVHKTRKETNQSVQNT